MPKDKIIHRECLIHGVTAHILEGRGYYRCKECRNHRVHIWRKNQRKKLVEHFGGNCEICGYNRCLEALQFHHLDPQEKEFGLSRDGITRPWKMQLAEAMKCILVCGNCHVEVERGVTLVPPELIERFEAFKGMV
jgi:hypothetical protein